MARAHDKSIHFVSLGCVKNKVDTEVMLGVAGASGYAVTEDADSAAYQDEVETLRDPTHRRIYTQREWIAFAEEAGLRIAKLEVVRKAHDFEPWLERGGVYAGLWDAFVGETEYAA